MKYLLYTTFLCSIILSSCRYEKVLTIRKWNRYDTIKCSSDFSTYNLLVNYEPILGYNFVVETDSSRLMVLLLTNKYRLMSIQTNGFNINDLTEIGISFHPNRNINYVTTNRKVYYRGWDNTRDLRISKLDGYVFRFNRRGYLCGVYFYSNDELKEVLFAKRKRHMKVKRIGTRLSLITSYKLHKKLHNTQ